MATARREIAKQYMQQELEALSTYDREVVERFIGRGRIVRHVSKEFEEQFTAGQKIADGVAAMMGSWRFIIVQSLSLAIWISLNVTGMFFKWDPYPFILLNLVLSFQAAYAAPIIMMSQNRQAEKDRLQSTNDYQINTKAELEVLQLHVKLDELSTQKWQALVAMQQEQIGLLERIVADLRTVRPSEP